MSGGASCLHTSRRACDEGVALIEGCVPMRTPSRVANEAMWRSIAEGY